MDLGKIGVKRAKLAAELQKLDAAEQAEKDRRAAVAGHALLAEADSDPEFQTKLNEILGRRLRKKRDRALFDLGDVASGKGGKAKREGNEVGNG